MEKREIDRAAYHLKQAVELNPDYAVAMRNLGLVHYFHLGNPKEAVAYFSRSLSLDPNQPEADNIRRLIKLEQAGGLRPAKSPRPRAEAVPPG